ncbi:acyl-CoA dehydrogenase family protein, partial [Mycobacterium sp. NAZ190054]|uniref:acyl-CoA dehydrogenase family protein n=1 Tax=Mycobacterium sp. NAZ190054 TaxID=1747766 RepID=UPI000AC801D5
LDAVIIGVERGRLLQPGPFVGSNVVAWALASDDTGDWTTVIESIVEGRQAATWACGCDSGVHQGEGQVELRVEDNVKRLYGRVTMVQDAETADWILVTFQSGQGLRQVVLSRETDGLTIESLDGLDITRRFATVTFAGVQLMDLDFVEPGRPVTSLFERQSSVATVLSLAETVGAMDQDFSLAVEYARVRIAFGRPIGSFQSVKHALADTSLNLEISKALLSAAANAVQDDADDQHAVVAVAKSFVNEASVGLSHTCFQVFGGIGFTWEHDHHLYYRRLAVDAQLYGSAESHRESLCVMNGL